MRGLHVSSATFLKRGNFCDFLFIHLDESPSKKRIEAVHVRLDFSKLCSFFVVTLVSESISGLDVWLCHSVAVTMDGWMKDLRFNNLLNSISVISGQLEVDYERLCAMEPHLQLRTGI